MTTRIINSRHDLAALVRFLKSRLPSTVTISKGRKRSADQNRLQRMWLNEAAEQLGEYTPEEYRAYCKLHFGVPILRAESEEFCEAYDNLFRDRFDYEEKLRLMAVPMDFPVTRLMTSKQKTAYLDAMYQHFYGQGVNLTRPDRL